MATTPTTTATPAPSSVPGAAGSTPTTAPAGRPAVGGGCGLALAPAGGPQPVGHCTVLEVGDSLGNDLGWGMTRHLPASTGLHLVQDDVSSTGLAKPSFYDWPAHLAADVQQTHPQLVVICMGGNDQQGMVVGGSAVEFPSPAWKQDYLARAERLVHEATAAGAYALWVGLPIMEQPGFSQGVQILDDLDQQAVATDPNARYLSTWSLLAGPGGVFEFSGVVGGATVTLRQPDGIHFSYAGEDVVATYVIQQLAAIFHVRLAPTSPAVVTAWG